MNARAVLVVAGLLLALYRPTVLACGVCIEDKMAAVYDHSVVTQALDRKHHVAFFTIEGKLAPGDGVRRAIEAIAESAHGVDEGSVRVSVESATLSVAFDPRRTPFAQVHAALERKLAVKTLALLPLRVMDGPASMKAVGRQTQSNTPIQ